MKKLFILSFLLFQVLFSFAQNNENIIISGKIIDSSTKDGISFASVWIDGTNIGVSTDADGSFTVDIAKEYKSSILNFTSIGYSHFEILISEKMKRKNLEISLDPKLIIFSEVNVSGKSLVLERILRTASDRIKDNYLQKAFSFDSYYKSEEFEGDSLLRKKENLVKIYYADAYKRNSLLETYKAISYRFVQARRNRENISLSDASSFLDDILSFDVVRNTRNILDKHNLDKYDLCNAGEMYFEEDSIIAISYKAKNNDLSIVGQLGVKKYSGKIYINKFNYAIIKNELDIELNKIPMLGKSIISDSYEDNNARLKIVSSYSKIDNHYCLRGISYDLKDDKREIKTQLLPVKIYRTNPEIITGRDYYEDEEYNKNFWDKFSLVFEGED